MMKGYDKKNIQNIFLNVLLAGQLMYLINDKGQDYEAQEKTKTMASIFSPHLDKKNTSALTSTLWRKQAMNSLDHYKPYKVVKKTLSNGLRVWLIEDNKLPYLDFTIFFNEGLKKDLEKTPGAMYLLTQMMDKGTHRRNEKELLDAVELLGSSINVALDKDFIGLSMESLSDLHVPTLSLFSEVLMSSNFQKPIFEREKKKAMDFLKTSSENFSAFTDRILTQFIYGKHPYGKYYMGTLKGLKQVTHESVLNLYKNIFRKEKALLVVCGNLPQDILKKLEEHFKPWKVASESSPSFSSSSPLGGGGKKESLDSSSTTALNSSLKEALPSSVSLSSFKEAPILLVNQDSAVQSEIRIASFSMHRAHPDYLAFILANYVLGGSSLSSRLMTSLRVKKGFTYGVTSILDSSKHTGTITIRTSVRNSVLGEAIEETHKILKTFYDKGITKEELNMAKPSIKLKFISASQSADSYGAYLANNLFILGVNEDYFSSLFKNLDGLSLDQVNKVIKKHFHFSNLKILVLSRAKEVKKQLKQYPKLEVKDYKHFL